MPHCLASRTFSAMAAVADFSQSESWASEAMLKGRWPEQSIELQRDKMAQA